MITTERHDDVLEILLDNPPVNALGEAVRRGLDEAVTAGVADPAIRAIVIRGKSKLFCAGADITEFGKPLAPPDLPSVIERIEQSTKPIVAAIKGTALGGGLEVALACHYRLATPTTKLGLPEVKLGILPGAGGTQRLPRLVGIEAALAMIVLGDPVSAERALAIGLVDALAPDDELAAEAIAYARKAAGPRRTGERTVTADPAAFERFATEHARKIKGLDAPAACLEAVKAATELSLADGLAKERELFTKLVNGAQSKALRHIFFAERAAAKIDGLPAGTARRSIRHVGILGAGTMGGGIAMNFLGAGIAVTIVETAKDALDRGVGVVRKNYEASAAKGKLTAAQVESAMGLLTASLDYASLATCDLVIEAVYEDLELKKRIFRDLDAIAKPGAILATNTSYQNVDEIAAATKRPEDVLGLHFFSPANIMKLVEVVRAAKTTPDVLATAMDLARTIGKVPVVAGVCYGFIGNRMLIPRQTQANALLLEGATPEQVDRVHTAFGMPMGPFQMADLAGVDIGWHRDPTRIETVREALCAAGRLGQKTKAGFYDYDEKRRPTPSAVTTEIVERFRAAAGRSPRTISDEEITTRTLYTMVNEGMKILEEGIAQRSSDIDVVWAMGYGWPTATGGPMFWANTVGMEKIASALEKYRAELGPSFTLAKGLTR